MPGTIRALDIAAHRGEFFSILARTPDSQVGVMTIGPGGDSGPEDIHPGDQIIYVIAGTATVELDDGMAIVPTGSAFIVPGRMRHHIYNRGSDELFFLTCYAPPAY